MRLGLVGFEPDEIAGITAQFTQIQTRMSWRLADLGEADALFAHGGRATLLVDGSVQIRPGSGDARPVRIDLTDSDRPLAFSQPRPSSLQRPCPTFDLARPETVRAVLEQFSGWLRPMALRFWLASTIVEERLDLSSHVYHVSVEGRLHAVVSRRTGVGVLPIADPTRLEDAIWARRPALADEIPGHFVQTGLPQVLWQYAMRTRRNLLPPDMRSGLIYWCRAPQLPQRLFRDSHLTIVRILAHAPTSYAVLMQLTGLEDAVLTRDLAALRIVGAITHDRRQAQRAAALAAPGTAAILASPGRWRAARSPKQDAPVGDKTAPAPLVPQES